MMLSTTNHSSIKCGENPKTHWETWTLAKRVYDGTDNFWVPRELGSSKQKKVTQNSENWLSLKNY